jgi:hypothetical protein
VHEDRYGRRIRQPQFGCHVEPNLDGVHEPSPLRVGGSVSPSGSRGLTEPS